MKKHLLKIIVCVLVFFVTLIAGTNIYNQRNTDNTAAMMEASLPLVHIKEQDIMYNTLHGLRTQVDGTFFRDTLTPLQENRGLSFVVDKYGNDIRGLSFEVRSIDGTRLVESTPITVYEETEKQIHATVTIKDLIDENVEYNWILKVELPKETVSYYTRIMEVSGYHVYEKLSYVKNFHEKTFDKEAAKELVSYLESNSKGDNTTLNKVDIHCSLSQVTWGDLEIEKVTPTQYVISEIDKQTASIRTTYIVQTSKEQGSKRYVASEYYRIRYTSDRTYLLEFERTMNQIFDPNANVYASNKIMLGIRDDEVQMVESDGGSNLAFVNEGQLFCYHATDKKMAYIFGFYDDLDVRTLYNNYDIKILNVDETGNVSFMVYGYMNRGRHEGEIGVQIYDYNGMLNHIEERIFIPYHKTFATLKTDIEQLAYMNKSDVVFLYLDGAILAVNLLEQNYSVVVSQLQEGSFQVSEENEMLVWQNTEDVYSCTKLILMNLNTGKQKEISTMGENRMLPLGFINEDLIYGVARFADIMMDSTGAITFPMYAVYIQNEQGDILKNYEQKDLYVVGCTIKDNLITLERVRKNEEGTGYVTAVSDQIVNNVIEEEGYNTVETVATQNFEKIVQLVLKGQIETKNLKITEPKEILFEGSRELVVELEETIDRYYVYGKNGISGTFTHPADAINLAYQENGTVVDENGVYIWKKTSRSTRNQIMKINGVKSDASISNLGVCIETMLDLNGISCDVQALLDQQQTVTNILTQKMSDAKILELQGVSLDAILYYVNMDIPALVTLDNEEAMLVIGFNETQIVVMDPQLGTVYKIPMSKAKKLFEDSGNQFVAYMNK